ncbi:hypothetical protein B0J11DRAFT_527597 [Dendryphion nanum]|uniref:CCZ1/INTU/HSP4 first Longin domain-containing protein n=1 Tax=Dendryphion nanum TaxID=256645 RepID=A0A9P9IN09_9PLEO|nr:hypothetical protein B0J11DRAFT_527597 [Dendryphion nanum]
MSATEVPRVLPAQLSFLAIYNPSLSSSDEDVHKQIVFYYSRRSKTRRKAQAKSHRTRDNTEEPHDPEKDEQLLQVGLAQGIVGFARSFSNGEAVESIDTDKSRIILTELEEDFWVLASIDLTRLPAASTTSQATSAASNSNSTKPEYEYSSREVSPPALLIQQLKAAYSVFCLHHTRLSRVLKTQGRDNFERVLHKFWAVFARRWDVLLHGSPAVDIFGGLKLASGGELGVGVGEEEWGSPERDVLEGYVRSTDGLVDVLVSRFGESEPSQHDLSSKSPVGSLESECWLGNGRFAGPSDGVVFAGTGAISRQSLRDISRWVETIYTNGEHAYGVQVNPTSGRDKTKRKQLTRRTTDATITQESSPSVKLIPSPDLPPGIPPPIVQSAEASLHNASRAVESNSKKPESSLPSLGDVNAWAKYITNPYGSFFGSNKEESVTTAGDDAPDHQDQATDDDPTRETTCQIGRENTGYFLIGLQGDLEDEDAEDARIPHRLLHVELAEDVPPSPSESPMYEQELQWSNLLRKLSRLRVIVYVHRPFVYVFLFKHSSPLLSYSTFYRHLHSFFSPLNTSFSKSTSPERVAQRILEATHPYTTDPEPNTQAIYDLVYDPRTLTIHSTIPNIPEPGTLVSEGLGGSGIGWSRVEALHVYSHILSTVSESRSNGEKIEQTCKTSRGWWVAWMRLPPSGLENSKTDEDTHSAEFNTWELREAFLVRRGRDAIGPAVKSSGRFSSGMWGLGGSSTEQKMGGAAAGWGPKGLAEGIGIDARRYIEEVLSLCR